MATDFVNMHFKDTQVPEMLLKKRADIQCTIVHIHPTHHVDTNS